MKYYDVKLCQNIIYSNLFVLKRNLFLYITDNVIILKRVFYLFVL